MNFPGGRYDLEAMREAARAKKAAEKRKKIIGIAVNIVIVAVLLSSAWYGWNKWQDHREEEREMERLRQAEEARKAAEREKKLKEEREAERKRREQERREKEERDAARKKAIEDEKIRLAEQKLLLEEKKLRQQEKERAEREWQEKHKSFADNAVKELRFDPKDYVMFQAGCEECFDLSVSGERWESFSAKVVAGSTIDLLRELNDGSVTNEFSETHYPDHATTRAILKLLDKERFTMVFRPNAEKMKTSKIKTGFALLAVDEIEGLTLPKEGREMKDAAGKSIGYTAPFNYGVSPTFYIMGRGTASKLLREWRAKRNEIVKAAEKLDNKDAYIRARLGESIGNFIASVKAEMMTPEPEPAPAKPAAPPKPKRTLKPLKGTGNMRSFGK